MINPPLLERTPVARASSTAKQKCVSHSHHSLLHRTSAARHEKMNKCFKDCSLGTGSKNGSQSNNPVSHAR